MFLDALNARDISNAIIVMDNAEYHNLLSDSTTRRGWRKADISQAATDYGLYVDPGRSKPEIWTPIEDYIRKIVIPAVYNTAGHDSHKAIYNLLNTRICSLSRLCRLSPKALLSGCIRVRRSLLIFLLSFKKRFLSCSYTP